jgi:hypothetical protein
LLEQPEFEEHTGFSQALQLTHQLGGEPNSIVIDSKSKLRLQNIPMEGEMVLTFTEAVHAIASNSENSSYGTFVNATLVITQQDGRTGFSEGYFTAIENGNQLGSGSFGISFNDRYSRDGSRFSSSTVDQMAIQVESLGSQLYKLHITLLSWGNNQYSIDLEEHQQSKMLVGWGNTIGFGEGQAIYTLAFTSAFGQIG